LEGSLSVVSVETAVVASPVVGSGSAGGVRSRDENPPPQPVRKARRDSCRVLGIVDLFEGPRMLYAGILVA